MKQATEFSEIDNATNFSQPVGPDDTYYVDLSDMRGEFKKTQVYRTLGVAEDFRFDYKKNSINKKLVFLAGMRGSGKTTELAKYAQELNKPECFYCITCNVDTGLNINNLEYMDVLIFQMEQLLERVNTDGLRIPDTVTGLLSEWFSAFTSIIRTELKSETALETSAGASTPKWFPWLQIAAKLKAAISASGSNTNEIRDTLRNNFTLYAAKFNEFVEHMNSVIRDEGLGQEILFIIDGLEKTMTANARKSIIIDNSNYMQQIRAYTIFTLPIELTKHRSFLSNYSYIISFPFLKTSHRDGTPNQPVINALKNFLTKRISTNLFTSEEVLVEAIKYCGGSPRELLRIVKTAYYHAPAGAEQISFTMITHAIKVLAGEYSRYITSDELKTLIEVENNFKHQIPTPFNDTLQKLTEDLLVLEYNDGSDKRVHPIVQESEMYKKHILPKLNV